MKGPGFCRRQKGGIFWPGLVLAARGAEKDFFHNICAGELHQRAGKIHPRQDYKSPGFLCAAKNCVDVSEAEICKICAQGKKEKMLALKYVKPGKAQGGPLTQTSARGSLIYRSKLSYNNNDHSSKP